MRQTLIIIFIMAMAIQQAAAQAGRKTKNLVIVTLDGFRWQELYRGADSVMVNSKEFNTSQEEITNKYIAETPQQRRKMLLPFFWGTLAEKGQLYGNRDLGNKEEVANRHKFSYPGYNEIFTGFPDTSVNSNDKKYNPNSNVLEFLNKQKGFQGKVVAFSSWDVFPWILNDKRSGVLVNSGVNDLKIKNMTPGLNLLNEMQHLAPPVVGDDIRLDVITYQFGKQYMQAYKPRVTYIAFDEIDDFAHAGNYKFYLEEAHKTDAMLKDLWDYIQSDPFYKDQTTLLITTDHGRGENPMATWKDHGAKVKDAEQTWIAVIGPDTPAAGEVNTPTTVYHKQIAQTLAGLLGFDFKSAAGHEVGEEIKTVTGK